MNDVSENGNFAYVGPMGNKVFKVRHAKRVSPDSPAPPRLQTSWLPQMFNVLGNACRCVFETFGLSEKILRHFGAV